jgi:hypothetical protein
MCIYGVTQIGRGSLGTSRFLPHLLRDASTERFLPRSLTSEHGRTWLTFTFFGSHLALVLALLAAGRRNGTLPQRWVLGLVLGGLAALIVSGFFLVEVAAPTLLGLPHHHCPYDLIPQVPEAIVAIVLYLTGLFLLGWGCVAQWCGRCPETEPLLGATVRHLWQLSFWAYVTSWIMLTIELVLAWDGAA